MSRILESKPLHLEKATLRQNLYEALTRNPADVYIEEVQTGRSYTYGEIFEKSKNFAIFLKHIGLKEGDVLLVCAESDVIETYIVILGVWLSGVTLTPIYPNATLKDTTRYFQVTRPVAMYYDEKYVDKLKQATQNLDWNMTYIVPNGKYPIIDYYDCIKCPKTSTKFVLEESDPDGHILSIMFTSGTSGEPKACELRSEAIKYSLGEQSRVNSRIKLLMTSFIFWSSNTASFISTTINHGIYILAITNDPEKVLQAITDHKPHVMLASCTLLMKITEVFTDKYSTSSLKKVYFGGSPLLPESKKTLVEKVFHGRNILSVFYGSTEAGVITSYDITDLRSPKAETIGKPLPGVKVKIIDVNTGKIVEPYKNGEICVKSGSVIRKYVQRALTNEELDADGWWHTGDIGYYDEEGYIYYVSRLKEVMKCRGFQVAPLELETIIQRHPDVIECCIVGKPHPLDIDQPSAFVVKRPTSSLKEEDVYDMVSREVIDAKNLRGGVYFVNSIPKSAVGKPVRNELLKYFN